MVKIICRAVDCIFWEDNLCTSDEITYDPDEGCLTYEVIDDVIPLDDDAEDDWDDEEDIEELDSDDFYYDEEEDIALYDEDEDDLDLYDDDDDNW